MRWKFVCCKNECWVGIINSPTQFSKLIDSQSVSQIKNRRPTLENQLSITTQAQTWYLWRLSSEPPSPVSYLYTFLETQIGKEAHTHCHIKWVLQKKKKNIEAHSYRHFFFSKLPIIIFKIFFLWHLLGIRSIYVLKKEKILHPFSNVNDKATVWHTPCLFPKLPTLRKGISLFLNILISWGVHLLLKSGREISPIIKKEGRHDFPPTLIEW
jgi:hypothetical protein